MRVVQGQPPYQPNIWKEEVASLQRHFTWNVVLLEEELEELGTEWETMTMPRSRDAYRAGGESVQRE